MVRIHANKDSSTQPVFPGSGMTPPHSASGWPRYFGLVAGTSLLIIGSLVLLGWSTHQQLLVQVLAHWRPMAPATAVGFIFCGLALLGIATG